MSEVAAFQMFLSLQYFNIMVVTVGPKLWSKILRLCRSKRIADIMLQTSTQQKRQHPPNSIPLPIFKMAQRRVLVIAGSDSSGGA